MCITMIPMKTGRKIDGSVFHLTRVQRQRSSLITTIPLAARRVLELKYGDSIVFEIVLKTHEVKITKWQPGDKHVRKE